MRALRTLVACAAAVLVTASVTPQAFAAGLELDNASGISSRSCDASVDGGSAGDACFRKYGDYFYLFGYSTNTRVVVQWRLTDGSRSGLIRWTPSAQFTNGVKNKDLPENKYLEFRFGVCQPGSGCDAVGDAQWLSGWRLVNNNG
jgi:hypothetical protein